jgi:hypothetical protein
MPEDSIKKKMGVVDERRGNRKYHEWTAEYLDIHKLHENLRRYLVAHLLSTHIAPCA